MSKAELINKLAFLRNICSTFIDFRGDQTRVPDSNIEQVLAAMGYDPHNSEQLERDATELDRSQWLQRLEPVVVLNPLRGHCMNLYISQAEREESGHWQIIPEHDQAVVNGYFTPGHLNQTGDYWIDDTRYLRLELELPDTLPAGYHRIRVSLSGQVAETALIVAPAVGFQPESMARGDRVWGTAIQLYTLRSATNWGIGDFNDLSELVEELSGRGADVIGLNPIHALYPTNPEHASPYSPSNRSYINPLYIAIENVVDYPEAIDLRAQVAGSEFQAQLRYLREQPYVDYSLVSQLKYGALAKLFQVFKSNHLGKGSARDRAFQAFLGQQGEPLKEHATFEALLAYFHHKDGYAGGWPAWPEEFQQHHSQTVQAFVANHQDDITYYQYLQFIADEQLRAVDRLARAKNMGIGLYRDLAVGADRGGAEVWSNRESFCLNAAVGAPPDALGPNGQNWGLPPLDPVNLKAEGYQSFITLLRNNMRASGALRIDHAMALLRLWWCPPGESAAMGAYVYYDLYDMLGILNLESQRNHCMVIAEDLGTVPEEITQAFPRARLYSNKVFYFEISDGICTPPEAYPQRALAIVCNHDMPTVDAFWSMSDLDLRWQMGMFLDAAEFQRERKARNDARQAMLDALVSYQRLPAGVAANAEQVPVMTLPLCLAIHEHLGSCQSQIVTVQLEDLMLMNAPVNIPGTSDEYPNWRRKLSRTAAGVLGEPEISAFCKRLVAIRSVS